MTMDPKDIYESEWKLIVDPLRIRFIHNVGDHVVEVEQVHR